MSEIAHRYLVTVSVTNADGTTKNLGTWDRLSGGAATADVTKYRPGGMGAELAFGGLPTYDDLTVARHYDASQDVNDVPYLQGRTGKGKVTVTRQPLNTDGQATGDSLVYSGILSGVTPPDVDSTSADVTMLEITVSVASVAKGAAAGAAA